MASKFKVSFELDEEDAAYFRNLYRKAKQGARQLDPEKVIKDARDVVAQVEASRKTPRFVSEAIHTLADLAEVRMRCELETDAAHVRAEGEVSGPGHVATVYEHATRPRKRRFVLCHHERRRVCVFFC